MKINRALLAIVFFAITIIPGLLSRTLWIPLIIIIILAITAFLWLVWRVRPKAHARKTLPLRQRIVITIVVLAVLGTPSFIYLYVHAKVSRLHDHLKKSGLPGELYEHQKQLETLTINQAPPAKAPLLSDVDWLQSDNLKNFTLVSSKLNSLDGLAHTSGLKALDIDLTGAPVSSLGSISSLQGLGSLTLRGVANAKGTVVPVIGESFPELTQLYLDFHDSKSPKLSQLPVLTGCKQLQDLTFDLRFTTQISELPDLSQLPNLQTLTMFLDNSQITSLSPLLLEKIAALERLTLGLNGNQLGVLSGLSDTPGPEKLEIHLSSPPNRFPDLHRMSRLNSLTLHMVPSIGTEPPADRTLFPNRRKPPAASSISVPDISNLTQLAELAIFLHGSDVSQLPPIGKLTHLAHLYLDLASSPVTELPDIFSLHDLQRLTLVLNNTGISQLPDFTPLSKLVELHLLLANDTNIQSLRIENLSNLETLELDITRNATANKISDLASSLVKFTKLKRLSLHLRWEQVHDLPDLHKLNLQRLELNLEGGWTDQEFPDFNGLQEIQELVLDIHKSQQVRKLPELSGLPKLQKITLNLDRSWIEDLSPLERVTTLEELTLSLVAAAHIQNLPDLKKLTKLLKVTADISHSQISLDQTQNLAKLQELTVDKSLPSLQHLPETVTKLHFKEADTRE